jgi:hypothetical protein
MREHNIQAHADIEAAIQSKGAGQMTFTLRINGGNIVDFSLVEYVDVRKKYAPDKYSAAGTTTGEKSSVSRDC